MAKNKNQSKFIFFTILLLQTLLILVFTQFSPYICDDYSNLACYHTFNDIKSNILNQYFNWGGSLIGNFFLGVFLILPKTFFNLFTAITYTGTVLLIYFHIIGKKETNNLLLLVICSLLWFIPTAWGQDFIWITGNAMYGTPTFFTLLLLLPLRLKIKETSVIKTVLLSALLFIAGVFVSWSTANTSVAVCVFCICILIERKLNSMKTTIPEIAEIIGLFVGSIFMIAAPGNYVRMAEFSDSRPFIIKLASRFGNITINTIETFHVLLPLLIAFVVYFIINKKYKDLFTPGVYFISFLAAFYSMIMSPTFPSRAMLMGIVFFIITLLQLYIQIEKTDGLKTVIRSAVISFSFLVLPVSAYKAARNIYHFNSGWKQRITFINEQKAQGNLDLTVPNIKIINFHVSGYDLVDLSKDPNEFPNPAIAQYFGLNSITGYEE